MEANPSPPLSLIDRASHVQELATRYDDLRRLADKRRQFEKQLETLGAPTQNLALLNEVRRQLAAEGIPLQALIHTGALREELQALFEDFRK